MAPAVIHQSRGRDIMTACKLRGGQNHHHPGRSGQSARIELESGQRGTNCLKVWQIFRSWSLL